MMKMNRELSQAVKHWGYIAPLAHYPENKKQFNKLVIRLDELLKVIGKNEKHPLIGLVNVISHFIEEYEAEHYHREQEISTGVDALKFLMEAHELAQSDLPEIGSQGVVSEILSGKRLLNVRQIKILAETFGVDPSTFI